MNKLFLILFYLLSFYLLFARGILASEGRNIFGLHLTQTSDLVQAKDIINSGGGQWGWVTIVLRQDQLDKNTWQDFFDNCRRSHIIPIIRIATIMQPDGWKKPEYSDIDSIASFLNGLNWPTQKQYIILFNEINHASEWGGGVDIKNFTDIAIYASQKFKSLNPNFFILSPGLDLAAPDRGSEFLSAPTVYREIYYYNPHYFDAIDGIASHSYPNHGFVGSPTDRGQHSIHGYDWELSFLKLLGIFKSYPVFITETGWPHREGESQDNSYYSVDTSAAYLVNAYNQWLTDNRVEAITPFIYNYPYAPFDHFSWLDKSNQLYSSYQQLLSLPKNSASPSQNTQYQLVGHFLPFIILPNQEYTGTIILKNTGQSIWGETNYCIDDQSSINITGQKICTDPQLYIEPGKQEAFTFKFKINTSVNSENNYLAWKDILPIEIKPVFPLINNATIYHPKASLWQGFNNLFNSFFNRL